MYYPYFRGKQFELIAIREMSKLLSANNFVPLIEPVRESLGGLNKTLRSVIDAGGRAIVIVNPCCGDHQENGEGITSLLQEEFFEADNISAGILLRPGMTVDLVLGCYKQHLDHHPVLIHAGFTDPKALSVSLGDDARALTNVFIEDHAKLLYRRHFDKGRGVLVRDGFRRLRNSDYPQVEEFSDLHVTYSDFGVDGFGDFLIVGDSYSERGGPAYAVAIHITFVDPDKNDVMYVYHFVSDTKDTPTDPAGKFAQALEKLIAKLDSGASNILETDAIKEFRYLHERGHFPGLGYIKKLSMKHHIETLARYFG